MLETLTRGFRQARLKLQGKAALSDENIKEALRDVRVSLLEADVELGVVKDFLAHLQERALGEVVPLRAGKGEFGIRVTPGDHFVKLCHEELVALMGGEEGALDLTGSPAAVMMVGLQGSGKTTTAGKLAGMMMRQGKKPMLVAADIYRPAAVEQLMTIGRRLGVPVFYIKGMKPVQMCELAMTQARNVKRDVVIFDTAGRLAIDNELMTELEQIRERTKPANVLFVCDAMIGQDSVRTAAEFDRRLDFSGFILTKMDGDARGGAALSIRKVTGKPIKFLGMGEGLDKLEPFRAEGLAGRILGMGDVVGLMRDFEEVVDEERAEKDAMAMLSGNFTFDTFVEQIRTIRKMGSLKDIVGKMPMLSDMMDQIPADALEDKGLVQIEAIIQSMTFQERAKPDLINDSRMRRIAKGCGRKKDEVDALIQRFKATRQAMRQMGQLTGMFGTPKQTKKMRREMARLAHGDPAAFANMGPAANAEPEPSADEKIAHRKQLLAERKARKKGR